MATGDKNEMLFSVGIDAKEAIREAKNLAKRIKDAVKAKDDWGFEKQVTVLKAVNREIAQIGKVETAEKKINDYLEQQNQLEKEKLKLQDASRLKTLAEAELAKKEDNYKLKFEHKPDTAGAINARADMEHLRSVIAGANADIASANANIATLESSMAGIVSWLEKMKVKAETFSAVFAGGDTNLEGLLATLETFSEKETEIKDGAEIIKTAVEDAFVSAETGAENAGEAFETTAEKINKAEEEAKLFREQMEDQEGFALDLDADVNKMSIAELTRYMYQLRDAMKEIKKEWEKQGYKTTQYDELYNNINNKLGEAQQAARNFGKEIENTKRDANEALKKSVVLVSQFTQQIAPANSMLGTLAGSIQRIGQAALQAGREAATALAEGTAGLSLILTAVAEFVNLAQTAAAKIVDSIKSVWNTVKSILDKIGDAIKKIVSLITSLAKTVTDHLKKAFDDTGRSSSNVFDLKNWKRALQLITKYVFGFRSFFFLYRKLRKGIADGLKNLVQFEGGANETNHAITELRTSLLYLKNAWAAAFAPVINAVYPILVQLMDMLAAVGNAIARFIAALTGQATVLQAVRVGAGDYAQSLADAGSSAGDAAKKQEELNDRLAEFDDLNVLGKDKDKTSPSGGGGGGGAADYNPNVNDMFVRIETPMNDLAKRLRELWEQGDFYGIGNLLATELSTSMAELAQRMAPGGDIYNKVMEAGRNISDLLDGILDVEDLGSNFGKLFGNAVVLGIDFLEEILTPDKFLKLGTHIANAMNEAIPLIVPKLGEFIGLLFTDAITGWYGWVTNADFARWGESIAQGLNNFLEQMNMTRIKGVLGKVEPLNAWQMLGIDITETVQGMIDMLGALIAGADWHALGEGIGQLLSNIDFGSIWEGLIDTRGHFLSGLGELWGGFSETGPSGLVDMLLPFIEALQDIPELLNTIKETLLEVFGLDGLTTTEKKVAFVRDTIQSIGEFIAVLPETLENLIETLGRIADVVESIFGTVGDTNTGRGAAAGAGIGAFFGHPFLGMIAGSNVGNILDRILPGENNALANAIDILDSQLTDGRLTSTVELFRDIGDAIDGAANSTEILDDAVNLLLGDFATGNATSIASIGSHFLGMSPNIGAVAISLKEVASEVTNVKGAFETAKNTMNLDTVDASLRATAETAKTSLSVIPDKFTEIKSVADVQSGDMKTKFTTAFDTIKQSSDDSSKVVSDSFTTASENIKTSFIGAWDEIKASISEGGDLFTALSDGLGNTMKALLNAMIRGINLSITKPLQDISSSFNVLRSLDVNGSKPFATIPVLHVPPIPYLAQGAVIPPNKEFMAVLGDQSHGTNIEAPLDTIRQAVGEEFAPYSEAIVNAIAQVVQAVNNKNLVIGDREIGKANARYESQQALIRGTML